MTNEQRFSSVWGAIEDTPQQAASMRARSERMMNLTCWRRRNIDPVCRFHVTQRDDCEAVGGLGIATAKGGSVKNRRLGQICVGTNTLNSILGKQRT